MDAGTEQRFGSVDVAYAHHDALIHEEMLHRRAATATAREQVGAIELLRQRLRPEPAQQVMSLARGLPEQGAEAARVGEAQHASAVECEIHMVVRLRGCGGREHPQTARHAQVQDGAAALGVEQQVLGATPHLGNALTRQLATDRGGDGPAQIGAAQRGCHDPPALDVGRDAAAGGFDFGQLGHRGERKVGRGQGGDLRPGKTAQRFTFRT
jgi:hypothetical protein